MTSSVPLSGGPATLRVVPVEDGDAARWDSFVSPRAIASTDLYGWRRVVSRTYGLRSWFLAAVAGDHVVGTLGLFEAQHPMFGRYLATAAFGNDGGFQFDGEPARDALLAEARALAERRNVDYLVIRTRDEPLAGFQVDTRYRSPVIHLEGGAEAVWNQRLDTKTRNQVRKGMKEGFSIARGHAQRDAFYEVFHHHMRDLGSPAHAARYYEAIVEEFGDRAEFFVVRDGSELVGGALIFWINDLAVDYHTVTLRKFNRRCPNYLLYWTMIEASCERGCRGFDMGRSEAEGPNMRFKLNWGPKPVMLRYHYHLVRARSVPHLDPRNPRYRLPILIWQRLPLFATKALGPWMMPGLL
jgi:FemAB-related protein (PEP-CTERM system-associated)